MSGFITVAELRMEAERLCDENERLENENAKLRTDNIKLQELVRDYEHCSVHADCDTCECDVMSMHCPLSPCFPGISELRELGVDVAYQWKGE